MKVARDINPDKVLSSSSLKSKQLVAKKLRKIPTNLIKYNTRIYTL